MATASTAHTITPEERKVIFASSLGTIFEWYDFYLYGPLAQILHAAIDTGIARAAYEDALRFVRVSPSRS